MLLEEQILSLMFSFMYGIFIMYLYDFFKPALTVKKYKIINAILFSINTALIYFLLNKRINEGNIHIYFIICFIVGILFYKKIIK